MSYISEKTTKIVDGLLELDPEIMFSYQRLVFNAYLYEFKEENKDISEKDLEAIKKFCKFAINSQMSLESITRRRRKMTEVGGKYHEYYMAHGGRKLKKKEVEVAREMAR